MHPSRTIRQDDSGRHGAPGKKPESRPEASRQAEKDNVGDAGNQNTHLRQSAQGHHTGERPAHERKVPEMKPHKDTDVHAREAYTKDYSSDEDLEESLFDAEYTI